MKDVFEKQTIAEHLNHLDSDGSLITGVKLDYTKTYPNIPDMLQKFIDNNCEESWNNITKRIDYIYEGVSVMLNKLKEETNFMEKVQRDITAGKLLIFKPNLMGPECISATTHNKGVDLPLNTQWPLVAAIMRWFHDNEKIHYSKMALAEGSCSVDVISALYSKALGYKVPVEAVFEGRCGSFYGGWGFYFVRKYLFKYKTPVIDDNPMEGYEESCNGTYLPPGKTINKMMVYDLNKIQIEPSRGKTISLQDGQNFSKVTLHKVVVGGEPENPEDLTLYPGCVLINIPVLKMHAQDLITNAIKNIGIGLYPTQCAASQNPSDENWIYASPNTNLPCYKSKLPHSPWMLEIDEKTHLPKKDSYGNYIAHKTEGFSGTQCDVIAAVQNQGTLMLHISDNIDIINISHAVGSLAQPVHEGFIWASLDCVALDSFCANYCFNNLSMVKGKALQRQNHWSTDFLQKVPIPEVKDCQIISKPGVDSPLLRYTLYKDAEKRGIGNCTYHVKGINLLTNTPMASHRGHLLQESNQCWDEVITQTLYYNPHTILHDLQATILGYAKAHDKLYGSYLYNMIMDTLDENGDKVINYNEKGLGFETAMIEPMAYALNVQVNEKYGDLKSNFIKALTMIKYSNSNWNAEGHDFLKTKLFLLQLATAFALSKLPKTQVDLFYRNIKYGNGYWPSFKTAKYINNMNMLFGGFIFDKISQYSVYGFAFQYCDLTMNSGSYSKFSNPLDEYFKDVKAGKEPLNFVFYVPVGYGKVSGRKIPNVIETEDPKLVFTVHFEEVW